ncbi:MAG TPA: AI-2E family transporter, partial [Candidatus Tectomicrobia bacterium]|nr:AI-2E family transporter [Candidatus Tectomicrobia bacterium]
MDTRADHQPSADPARPARSGGQTLVVLGALALAVAVLYVAQAVLMPVAVAVLLTYVLAPVVVFLQRWRFPRVVAVVTVVALVFVALGAAGWVVTVQMLSLGAELPRYRDNIKAKMADLRGLGRDSGLERATETVAEAAREVEKEVQEAAPPGRRREPLPVVVEQDRSAQLWSVPTALGPWLEPLGRAGLVAILVPFMLLARQELRTRVIRMIGFSRLPLTTRALDEANERVSRYLLTQSIVNATFGVLAMVALWLVGVPYAVLFGILAGALRFIPYVGPWIGALLPIAVSMAVFEGWTRPLVVAGFWVVLELFTNLVLETLLWARSAGVSAVGLLIAVAFWTWLWGAVGLVVATPLTVVLIVFAKHVPQLEFVWILMGDEPVLPTHVALYQRLLAEDEDEAMEIVDGWLDEHPREEVYDGVLLPALALAHRDRVRGRISVEDERLIVREMGEIVADLGPVPREPDTEPREPTRVVACPARGEADATALAMLRDLLDPRHVELRIASPDLLSAEAVQLAEATAGPVTVVGALGPGGMAQVRYLVKRLRAAAPEMRIVVGRWCPSPEEKPAREALRAAGADEVIDSLVAARDAVVRLCQARAEATRDTMA